MTKGTYRWNLCQQLLTLGKALTEPLVAKAIVLHLLQDKWIEGYRNGQVWVNRNSNF